MWEIFCIILPFPENIVMALNMFLGVLLGELRVMVMDGVVVVVVGGGLVVSIFFCSRLRQRG
jgi:hypothetical protein